MDYQKLNFNEYLDKLSSREPSPGGGCAAALVAALSVGLYLKSLRISKKNFLASVNLPSVKMSETRLGETDFSGKEESFEAIENKFYQWQRDAMAIAERDDKGFAALMQAFRSRSGVPEKAYECFECQIALWELCSQVKASGKAIKALIKKNIMSDFLMAERFLGSVMDSALETARESIPFLSADQRSKAEESVANK